MNYKTFRYEWLTDLLDHREHLCAAPAEIAGVLPASVNLRIHQLGICTANAVAAAVQFDQMKQKLTQIFTLSRLFIYDNERAIEHTVTSGSSAQIRVVA
jgi:hypothetical protein